MKTSFRVLLWCVLVGVSTACGSYNSQETANPDGAVSDVSDGSSDASAKDEESVLDQQRKIPPEVAQLLRDLGFPTYDGFLPPTFQAYFSAKGTVTASHNGRRVGTTLDTFVSIPRRTIFRSIVYQDQQRKGEGWITGEGNRFTLYISTSPNTPCQDFVVISGEKNGKQVEAQHLIVRTKACSDAFWERWSTKWEWVHNWVPPTDPPPEGADDPEDWYEPSDPPGPPPFP